MLKYYYKKYELHWALNWIFNYMVIEERKSWLVIGLYTHIHLSTYTNIYIHRDKYIHLFIYTYTHVFLYQPTHMHLYIYIYIYIYHIYIYIYTHTHTCSSFYFYTNIYDLLFCSFAPLKMTAVGTESPWKIYNIFQNLFHPKIKWFIRRLEWIKDWHSVQFNQTHDCVYL